MIKIAFNHASSPSLLRRPVHAIVCEIAHSPHEPPAPDRKLERATVDWLVAANLIASRGDVIETRIIDVDYGYPVYTPPAAGDRFAHPRLTRRARYPQHRPVRRWGVHEFGRLYPPGLEPRGGTVFTREQVISSRGDRVNICRSADLRRRQEP